MAIQPQEKTISDYKAAFRAANKKDVRVSYRHGWYTIARTQKVRESAILRMTDELRKRAAHTHGTQT